MESAAASGPSSKGGGAPQLAPGVAAAAAGCQRPDIHLCPAERRRDSLPSIELRSTLGACHCAQGARPWPRRPPRPPPRSCCRAPRCHPSAPRPLWRRPPRAPWPPPLPQQVRCSRRGSGRPACHHCAALHRSQTCPAAVHRQQAAPRTSSIHQSWCKHTAGRRPTARCPAGRPCCPRWRCRWSLRRQTRRRAASRQVPPPRRRLPGPPPPLLQAPWLCRPRARPRPWKAA